MKSDTYLLVELRVVVPVGVNTGRIPYFLWPVYRLIRRGGQHEQLVPLVGQQPGVHLLTYDKGHKVKSILPTMLRWTTRVDVKTLK